MRVTKEFEQGRAFAFSLWVTVDRGVRSHVFELDGQSAHAIVIGSTRDATHLVFEAELAPVECFLEREGEEIWLVPGTPSVPLRVDGVKVERPIRLWRRCSLEVAGYCYVVRIREEPPTARDLEIPARRVDHNGETFRGSGTLCGGFDLASLGLREPGSVPQELPPGVAQWQKESDHSIAVCQIVTVGSDDSENEPALVESSSPKEASGTNSGSWQDSLRRTDLGLSSPASRSAPMLTGAQSSTVPFRPFTSTLVDTFAAPEPKVTQRAGAPVSSETFGSPRAAQPAHLGMHPSFSTQHGVPAAPSNAPVATRSALGPLSTSDASSNGPVAGYRVPVATRAEVGSLPSNMEPAHAPVVRYRTGQGGFDASELSASSGPLSSGPLSSGPPSSAPAAVISVRVHSKIAVRQLERLGLFTRKRPMTVTLGVMMGAATIAVTMKFGTEAALAIWRDNDPNLASPHAQTLAHTAAFCRSEIQNTNAVQPERDACRWLHLKRSDLIPLGSDQPSIAPVNAGVPTTDGEPSITPTR